MRTKLPLALLFLAPFALPLASPGAERAGPPLHTKTILSAPLEVRGIIPSMQGPYDHREESLGSTDDPAELLWITGLRTEIVEEDGETPTNQDYMCHTNVDMSLREYKRLMYDHRRAPLRVPTSRMFTLSQGVYSLEFPDGFGVPVSSHQNLSLVFQVLNHNEKDLDTRVRHRATISFVRDADMEEPMIPLRWLAAQGLKSVGEGSGYWGMASAEPEEHGESCSPGVAVAGPFGSAVKEDPLGQRFTGHWQVKPGVEVNHTNATGWMDLHADTTLHYANVHLHPFAESIELKDVTAGKTILRVEAKSTEDRIGLAHIEEFRSEEGIPLYKDHQYEVVSRYNNTSDVEQTAMAVLILYVRDERFR